MPSRKTKTSTRRGDEWSVKNAWTWLTTPGHSHPEEGSRSRKVRKPKQKKTTTRRRTSRGSRTKRSSVYRKSGSDYHQKYRKSGSDYHQKYAQAYCSEGRRMKADEYGSRQAKNTMEKKKKKKPTKLGTVCVCAMGCQKDHEHDAHCEAAVVCVCAHGAAHKKMKTKKSSRKTSVAYRQMVREGYTPGKGPKTIPKLRQGTLRRHGYDSKAPKEERHAALRRAAKAEGPTVVIRKLNVVATLNKNTNPTLADCLKVDSAWVKSQFGTTAHPKTSR